VWGAPTHLLARELIKAGFKAKITCVDASKLDASFAGREYDDALLDSLPPGIDPCGENGEFHTFVYDAPAFATPINTRSGEIVTRDGFIYADFDADPALPFGGA
jgi:diphthamide synthase (EF-2-diphthine--ammonia ligase)